MHGEDGGRPALDGRRIQGIVLENLDYSEHSGNLEYTAAGEVVLFEEPL